MKLKLKARNGASGKKKTIFLSFKTYAFYINRFEFCSQKLKKNPMLHFAHLASFQLSILSEIKFSQEIGHLRHKN